MGTRWDHSELRPRVGTRPRFWHKLAGLSVAALVIGAANMALASTYYKNSLRTRIHTIAESVDADRVTSLRQAASDTEAQDETAYLKDRLARIKAANADTRFVYLMAKMADGQVYFLADSEPVGSDGYSPRGEVYPEASDRLRAMFDDGRLLVEGPVGDRYGSWLSALAPVVDDDMYRMTAVIGMDVPATTYWLIIGLAGGIPLLLAAISSIIVYIRYQTRSRRREHVQFRAEMISIASHELRTPLTGMRWSVESLLNRKVPAAKLERTLEIMYDSTLRLEESIEDILQLANLESGKAQRLYIKQTDLRRLMDDIIAMQRLAAERHNVTIAYSPDWPEELLVGCDAQRMKRVLHNLVSNAVKYSRPDTSVTLGYKFTDDGRHMVSISDQGIGIPAADQPHVWDGFYRAANADAHDIRGTGMGLYLSRTIIEQHGGHIWLDSVEGEGTTVYITLPDTAPYPVAPGS